MIFVRIIAGEFRGRQLREPKFDTTRPITDRAKQSLFDVLMPLIEGAIVFDCFSGTGSMGLECLSRGASEAVFFDADRLALKGLRENIEMLRVQDRSRIMAGDIFKLLGGLRGTRADLVFLDPPYRYLNEKPDALIKLADHLVSDHMAPKATLIFRHDAADALTLPRLVRTDLREYGSMAIELLQPATSPAE